MSELAEDRKKMLKELIKQLHSGASPEQVKEKFKDVLKGVNSEEIAKIEEELVKEGMPRAEIQRLCDIHLAVFREQLEGQKLQIPAAHPVNILMEEHKIVLQLSEKLSTIANKLQQISDKNHAAEETHQIEHIARDFRDSEKHYLREENVLFPILEKHGITEPPAIMWMEHDQIRQAKKQLFKLVEDYSVLSFENFKKQLRETAEALNSVLPSHFYKENNILFPTALRVFTEQEWKDTKKEFDEIGYCCFTPEHLTIIPEDKEIKRLEVEEKAMPEGEIQFGAGVLTKEEVEAILNTLPIDITFVGRDDSVKYFSEAERRIFARTRAIIGRKVQQCHPQKSVHIVNKIVEAFKTGRKNVAEFWINMNNRLIHIRYFAVRDKNGKYLGTMEVTQDLTDLKKIEGEKRLLEWEG
jgi:hypothetical protein